MKFSLIEKLLKRYNSEGVALDWSKERLIAELRLDKQQKLETSLIKVNELIADQQQSENVGNRTLDRLLENQGRIIRAIENIDAWTPDLQHSFNFLGFEGDEPFMLIEALPVFLAKNDQTLLSAIDLHIGAITSSVVVQKKLDYQLGAIGLFYDRGSVDKLVVESAILQDNPDLMERFNEILKYTKMIQLLYSDQEDLKNAAHIAYALTLAFPDAESAVSYISKLNYDLRELVATQLTFDLPRLDCDILTPEEQERLVLWQKLNQKFGWESIKLMQHNFLSVSIEELSSMDLQAIKVDLKYEYSDANKYPKLVEICNRFFIEPDTYLKAIEVSQDFQNSSLPDIVIEKKVRGQDFIFHKFNPVNEDGSFNWEGLFIGHYTGCCQSLKNIGERFAVASMTKEKCGLYVMRNKISGQIIAQAFAWFTKSGDIVFDSIETTDYSISIIDFIQEFARNIGEKKLYLGVGGKTLLYNFAIEDRPDAVYENIPAYDSDMVYVIDPELVDPRGIKQQYPLESIQDLAIGQGLSYLFLVIQCANYEYFYEYINQHIKAGRDLSLCVNGKHYYPQDLFGDPPNDHVAKLNFFVTNKEILPESYQFSLSLSWLKVIDSWSILDIHDSEMVQGYKILLDKFSELSSDPDQENIDKVIDHTQALLGVVLSSRNSGPMYQPDFVKVAAPFFENFPSNLFELQHSNGKNLEMIFHYFIHYTFTSYASRSLHQFASDQEYQFIFHLPHQLFESYDAALSERIKAHINIRLMEEMMHYLGGQEPRDFSNLTKSYFTKEIVEYIHGNLPSIAKLIVLSLQGQDLTIAEDSLGGYLQKNIPEVTQTVTELLDEIKSQMEGYLNILKPLSTDSPDMEAVQIINFEKLAFANSDWITRQNVDEGEIPLHLTYNNGYYISGTFYSILENIQLITPEEEDVAQGGSQDLPAGSELCFVEHSKELTEPTEQSGMLGEEGVPQINEI